MRKLKFFLCLLILFSLTYVVYAETSSSTINWLSKNRADTLYCIINGDCVIANLNVTGVLTSVSEVSSNVTGNINAYSITLNNTPLDDFYLNSDGDTGIGDYEIQGDLNVTGNVIVTSDVVAQQFNGSWNDSGNYLRNDGDTGIGDYEIQGDLNVTAGGNIVITQDDRNFGYGDGIIQITGGANSIGIFATAMIFNMDHNASSGFLMNTYNVGMFKENLTGNGGIWGSKNDIGSDTGIEVDGASKTSYTIGYESSNTGFPRVKNGATSVVHGFKATSPLFLHNNGGSGTYKDYGIELNADAVGMFNFGGTVTRNSYGIYLNNWGKPTVDFGGTTTDNIGAIYSNGGNWVNHANNAKILIGASQQSSIYNDGTDLVLNPKETGTGKVRIDGDLNITKNIIVADDIVAQQFNGSWNDSGNYLRNDGDTGIGDYDLRGALKANSFNWTSGDDWNNFDGSILVFNESKLSTQFFNASTIQVITGTPQGAITDLRSYNNIAYNVSEVNSDLELRINFTNITDFNQLIIRYKSTEEDEPHTLQVQIYDYEDSDWEDYGVLPTQETYHIIELGVYDTDEHIENGTVQVRFYQLEGVPNKVHKHNFDWVAIAKGFGTPAGAEVDPDFNSWLMDAKIDGDLNVTGLIYGNGSQLTGLDEYAKYQFEDNNFNGSGDLTTTGTITSEVVVTNEVQCGDATIDGVALISVGNRFNSWWGEYNVGDPFVAGFIDNTDTDSYMEWMFDNGAGDRQTMYQYDAVNQNALYFNDEGTNRVIWANMDDDTYNAYLDGNTGEWTAHDYNYGSTIIDKATLGKTAAQELKDQVDIINSKGEVEHANYSNQIATYHPEEIKKVKAIDKDGKIVLVDKVTPAHYTISASAMDNILKQSILEQQEEINLLKSELCKKDNSYPWCLAVIK